MLVTKKKQSKSTTFRKLHQFDDVRAKRAKAAGLQGHLAEDAQRETAPRTRPRR